MIRERLPQSPPDSVVRVHARRERAGAPLPMRASAVWVLPEPLAGTYPCAIFLAYSNWAGLTGLVSSFPAISPSALLGACSLRNLRQIEIDVSWPGGGLMPFWRTRLSRRGCAAAG